MFLRRLARLQSTVAAAAATSTQTPPAKKWSLMRKVLTAGGVVAAVEAGVAGYLGYKYYTDEHFRRPLQLYGTIAPVAVHYAWVNWRTKNDDQSEREAALEALHQKYAPQAVELMLSLRGMFIKTGQVLCTRADIVPETYRNHLKVLLDNVPGIPGEEAIAIIESGLGKPISELFATFDPKPIGAASIGQAHLATLHDGRDVVVKIQYPSVRHLFDVDFAVIRNLASWELPEMVPVLDEVRDQLLTELDFTREAWALETIGRNVMPHFDNVIIPRPVAGMNGPTVVVMEKIAGEKLVDVVLRHYEEVARSMGMTLKELQKTLMLSTNRPAASAPSQTPGPSGDNPMRSLMQGERGALTPPSDATAALLTTDAEPVSTTGARFRVARGYLSSLVNKYFTWYFVWGWNHSVARIRPTLLSLAYPAIVRQFDGMPLLQTLIDVHGHEIFVDGLFNGDPHPGNILLDMADRNRPVIGLIDYGQVKELTREERLLLARLIVALAKDDREETVQRFHEMGYQSEHMDVRSAYANARLFFDRLDIYTEEGFASLPEMMMDLESKDKSKKIPDFALLVGRVSMIMRGIGMLLCPNAPLSMAQQWLPYAQRLLHEEDARLRAAL
ncbi:hypothetical protein RI367_004525 [Sorochytrium milnesiophthora]